MRRIAEVANVCQQGHRQSEDPTRSSSKSTERWRKSQEFFEMEVGECGVEEMELAAEGRNLYPVPTHAGAPPQ